MARGATPPELSDDRLFITDGGLETSLIFRQGIELPHFAAFPLLDSDDGVRALRAYFEPYLRLAAGRDVGFLLDTPTWRASPDWGERLGYSAGALNDVNRRAVELARQMGEAADAGPIVVNGVLGPRGDGYAASELMPAEEAAAYHSAQVRALAGAGAEMISAVTMTYAEEAVGIAQSAEEARMPVAISFTVETDGRLPSGQPLGEAVEQVDAETGRAPAYFMINCAHPSHFDGVLAGAWVERIAGLRANASTKSHAELDEAEELDDGDPDDLAERYRELRARLPALRVVGGCCGTDERHVARICERLAG